MRRFILFNNQGNITASAESSDKTVSFNSNYIEISKNINLDDLLTKSKDYKVEKDIKGEYIINKIKKDKE